MSIITQIKPEEKPKQIEHILINSIIDEISDELLDTIYEMSDEILETGTCDSDAYALKLASCCQVFVDQIVDEMDERLR